MMASELSAMVQLLLRHTLNVDYAHIFSVEQPGLTRRGLEQGMMTPAQGETTDYWVERAFAGAATPKRKESG